MTGFSPPPLRAPTACVACNKKKRSGTQQGFYLANLFASGPLHFWRRHKYMLELPAACMALLVSIASLSNTSRFLTQSSRRERKRKRRNTLNSQTSAGRVENRIQKRRSTLDEAGQRNCVTSKEDGTSIDESENDATHIGFPPRHTPRSTSFELEPRGTPQQSICSNPYSSVSSLSFLARSRYFDDAMVINEDQARSYSTADADGPTEDDIQLLQLQRAFDLPPRAVRDGLINTFMEKCSPWMPIVERSWLEESGSQKPSILLLQAIFVAASRVTSAPAVTAYASTHQFYRRAKALIWSGYEKNPMTVVAAVCILHWYNPEGPEHVSTNTSGFWRYVGVGLAHQIGLQKEPANTRNAALRRRLWWTLFARDCLISAGQGRPLAVNIEDCELAPPRLDDFDDSCSNASLFIAYVEISSILGHLTQHCRRKTLTRQIQQNIENQLYRWTRDLPASLSLFQTPTTSAEFGRQAQSTLSPYNFEARQLHIPYFICLAILCRPNQGKSPSPAVVLASSFVAGIFEDFLARDEIQFLGPIFTFHLLAAGIGLLSSSNTPSLCTKAENSLQSIYLSLDVLSQRWSSAKGSLRALKSIADKQQNSTRPSDDSSSVLPQEQQVFFQGFGPEISWAWTYFMPPAAAPRTVESWEVHTTADHPSAPLDCFTESQVPNAVASSADEYRPLTTILDPHVGFSMGGMARDIGDDLFHNQYQGMGDWLFKDLDWNGDATW
ncbi:hypothetical protein N7532_004079 [Penicillium argentinense]|uniref:Xylanolytic transcriptional activator regulatory domain-containing protein n=1 Tax=Penicillium argentinense TaxID=1131581 RepID=A0A9W9FP58_9EURO|nr:uncharacterized protein N7532_004079 [Penicillium argentinense]KAJ5103550.1 hypothetical protein N7532_004079 [Penicillium argentinense]